MGLCETLYLLKDLCHALKTPDIRVSQVWTTSDNKQIRKLETVN